MVESNVEPTKLKTSVLLKYTSRPEEKILKFSKFYHAQSNFQNSVLSMVEHMIDRFGYVDICDHEISKKLHTEMLQFMTSVEKEENDMKNEKIVQERINPLKTETPKENTTGESKTVGKVQIKNTEGF